jgi:hypothetical protein
VTTQALVIKHDIGLVKHGNIMIKLTELLNEETIKCPVATQDVAVNLKHRQIAIERYGYGPYNPNNPSIKFWKDKMEAWKLDSIEEAKSARCNSCAAFNITSRILKCIEVGLSKGEKEVSVTIPEGEDPVATAPAPQPAPESQRDQSPSLEAWDTVDAGKLGYCTMLKFKCAGSRTCNAWVTGGPVKD